MPVTDWQITYTNCEGINKEKYLFAIKKPAIVSIVKRLGRCVNSNIAKKMKPVK